MIAEKFKRMHGQQVSDDGEHEIIPVVMMQMPAEATPTRFYNALLSALGTPIGCYGRYTQERDGFTVDAYDRCENADH